MLYSAFQLFFLFYFPAQKGFGARVQRLKWISAKLKCLICYPSNFPLCIFAVRVTDMSVVASEYS